MTYRDDLGAAQARAEALESRVAELETENRSLREGPEPPDGDTPVSDALTPTPLRRHGMIGGLVVALVGAAIAGAVAMAGALPVAVVVGMLAVALGLQIIAVTALIHVAPPGFAIVVSGRRRIGPDGREVGYRIISSGGRVVRMPIIEVAELVDLRPQTVSGNVAAYVDSNESVTIGFSASIKMAGHSPGIDRAIERFLGRDLVELRTVGAETIAGAVRTCAAERTVAEIRRDTERFTHSIIAAAELDLDHCGIVIDTLFIEPPSGVDED